jgi:hypothetical protein
MWVDATRFFRTGEILDFSSVPKTAGNKVKKERNAYGAFLNTSGELERHTDKKWKA